MAKAAIFKGANLHFEIKEYELCTPPEGMALMRLIASGVCGTDIHIHNGKLEIEPPKIIGHEFVGEVRDISEKDSEEYGIRKGDNVIVDIACPCNECHLCKTGDDANCINMGVTNEGDPEVSPHLWGGFAEYNYSPVKNLIKIPDGLDPKTVSVFACAGATAMHAFSLAKRANIDILEANTAVVQGLGPVGMYAAAYLAAMGIKNVFAVTGRRNSKREEIAYRFGVSKVFSLEESNITGIGAYIRSVNSGLDADMVFEASGNKEAIPQGIDLLRNRGVYLVPGQYSNSGAVAIQPQLITFKALHIIGSSQYSVSDVEDYLSFLNTHRNILGIIDDMITEYPVDKINEAFADAKAGKNIKTILAGRKI